MLARRFARRRDGTSSSRSDRPVTLRSVSNDKPGPQPTLKDPVGFADAYRNHSRAILVFLTRRTYDPETALDLTAETFARAFAGRRRFRGSTDDELAAWLFGIARNVLSRYLRRGVVERRALNRLGIDVPSLELDEVVRIVELAGLADVRDAVGREFRNLSNDQRQALRLRVIEELPFGEVARQLEVSEPTARARVSRGLRALAGALDQLNIAQEVSA